VSGIANPSVSDEWRRAGESLGAALVCRDNGFYADAVSRVYYAIMHGAKAALESRQVHAASHQGVISQFGLHFVKTDLIDREWGIRLSQSFKGRLAADYDATAEFDETDADLACGRAAGFSRPHPGAAGSRPCPWRWGWPVVPLRVWPACAPSAFGLTYTANNRHPLPTT
jgi:uncharacterized protein (UPF0332 family)